MEYGDMKKFLLEDLTKEELVYMVLSLEEEKNELEAKIEDLYEELDWERQC